MKMNFDKQSLALASSANQNKSGILLIAVIILSVAFFGCIGCNSNNNNTADRDQDGILDNIDQCPDEKGSLEYKGCASSTPKTDTAATQAPVPTQAPTSAATQQAAPAPKSSTSTVSASQPEPPKAMDARIGVIAENAMKTTAIETAPAPMEQAVKNVSARLKTNSGQNTISWNSELSKAKDLQLSITTASGLNFKKDVTGMNSYTFNPGSGEWQGKKCTVTLTSGDSKIIIDNSKLPNTFFNCSAE
jgi:hypothetical protein